MSDFFYSYKFKEQCSTFFKLALLFNKFVNNIGKNLAMNGVCFVNVNYRMYPEYKFPDFLFDAASAINFILNYY